MIEVLLQAEHALSLGLLDRAESLYRQVATADQKNAIAVVGLSRVALERGNQPLALELARRALTIDRENVAAQRLAQRLEEVIAFSEASPAERSRGAAPTQPDQVLPQRRNWRDRLLRRRPDR